MKLKIALAAFALLVACAGRARAQGQFPWQEYRTRTFAEVVKRNTDELAGRDAAYRDKATVIFSADPLHSQVRVAYTGTTRKVTGARRTHVDEWAATFGLKPEVAALYESEMLVVECSAEHWVPVQKQVMAHFEKELKKGDAVTLYAMFAGGRKIDGAWNWVFLVNEFQAYR
jgi:molybdopterin converting factor small subunit